MDDKEKIMDEFAENFRYVSDHEIEKRIGYVNSNDSSIIAVCAALLTITNHLTKEEK